MKITHLALLLFMAFAGTNTIVAQTQTEMNILADKKFKKVDSEMNHVYKQLLMVVNANDKLLLTNAQKNWLRFRDSHCKFEESAYTGGSIQPMVRSNCLTEVTKRRVMELRQSLKSRTNK